MKTNVEAVNRNRTHEGGMAAPRQSAAAELERAVVNCLLFENAFYEAGGGIAGRIAALCAEVDPLLVARLAVKAKDLGLRHAPLFLTVQLARVARGRTDGLVARTIADVIRRADELAEILALYWRDGRRPVSAQMKKGIALAFRRFDEHRLAKYDRAAKVKLRDALFLSHAKPVDDAQADLWKRMVDGKLATPDTWETALSAGANKKETFERLIAERKLGCLALLRNLRKMDEEGVSRSIVLAALDETRAKGVLPFQFIAAARFAPSFSRAIEGAMLRALAADDRSLPGSTGLLVDVSGSMDDKLSGRSQLSRIDAASALAIILAEAGDCRVWTFSNFLVEVPAHRGMGLADAIARSQGHAGTNLADAIRNLRDLGKTVDRFVVVTDEQSADGLLPGIGARNYLVNVAPYAPGLDLSGGWARINGFSERIADWIAEYERTEAAS